MSYLKGFFYCFSFLGLLFIFQGCQPAHWENAAGQKDVLFSRLSPKQTGIRFQNTLVEDAKNNHLINDMFVAGAGVAIGDIDGNGYPDIYLAGNQVPDRLYLNRGDLKFEDITEKSGIGADENWSTGVTMADVNNDGRLDIYVCKSVQDNDQLSSNLLFINEGPATEGDYPTFREAAANYNLADRGFSVQATFFDYNKDGWMDLYLVNQPPSVGKRTGGNMYNRLNHQTAKYTDRLYENTGNGPFVEVTKEAGVLNIGYGLSATVGDFNQDSWPDIYVSNDFDRPDHLYINQKDGTFRNTINQSVKHISNFSMGSDAADYDNDGLLDIMVVDMVAEDHLRNKTYMGAMNPEMFWRIVNNGWHYQYMFNTLQKNNGNGTFCEVAHLAGVSNTDWSWGPLFADFDNDGWKDLFVTNGIKRNQRYTDLDKMITRRLDSLELIAAKQKVPLEEIIDVQSFVDMAPIDRLPNYIFKNNGDLTFQKQMTEWGMTAPGLSYGGAYADLDQDGDLDLVINNVDDFAGIYRNNLREKDSENGFLRVTVQTDDQSPAYGARATLYKDGVVWQVQELTNARGYMSKSDDVLHFGLGAVINIEKMVISWPDGRTKSWSNVPANQSLLAEPTDALVDLEQSPSNPLTFCDLTTTLELDHRHRENDFNDFKKQELLPHKMSNFGPGLAVGDVNGDGLEDFYIGGATGFAGALYLQRGEGTFTVSTQGIWQEEADYEDIGSLLLDVDGDQDLDLYVVSGGNEFEVGDPLLQDRLYLNDGWGNFAKTSDRLPDMTSSGSRVKAADFDGDGDVDLFVGGRLLPGKYPYPAKSTLLINNGGVFSDQTAALAPFLMEAGLVTDAEWTDFNNDGQLDLVVVGEWMPVTMLENRSGRLENRTDLLGLQQTAGWYFSICAEDFDRDGDTDFVVGNLGLNYKYKASVSEPFQIHSGDLDHNGAHDIVLSYHEHGEIYPVRGRSCSSSQIPEIAVRFPDYESFGKANLSDIYGEELETALQLQAYTFATSYIENVGDNQYRVTQLPNESQFSNVNTIIAQDFDGDEHLDLLLAGNLYSSEIETPRNDAGMGLYMRGDGSGNFSPVPISESGFFAPHDVKDMKVLKIGRDQVPVVLIGNNNFGMQAFGWGDRAHQLVRARGKITM